MPATSAAPDASAAQPLMQCVALEVGYKGRALLPAVDMSVGRGELWAVVGRNGSGKTTLFRTMLGLVPPVRGGVRRARPDVRLSYVPQSSSHDALFPLLVRDVVAMGVERGWSFARPRLTEPGVVRAALADVDSAALIDQPFHTLSEGQRQRVLLARLAVSSPELAFLDEPTAAMDVIAEQEAFRFLSRLCDERNVAVVVVSHYLRVAREFADRVIFLDRDVGGVVIGSPHEVFGHPSFRRSYSERPAVDG